MPSTYICGFGASFAGSIPAWRWNGADTDGDFLTYITPADMGTTQNFTMDRSGPEPVLKWDLYIWDPNFGVFEPTGSHDELVLHDGDLIVRADMTIAVPNGADYAHNVNAGCWESDQYGRPFRLDDLLAE